MTYVRSNAYTPIGASMLRTYARGVTVMMSRDQDDPTSWVFQARIHGTVIKNHPSYLGQCQHGSYFFLAWHRMYLYFFERILRKASGDMNFALPYWNYSNGGEEMGLPYPFIWPRNRSNTLYVESRSKDLNDGMMLTSAVVDYRMAMAQAEFIGDFPDYGFGGGTIPTPSHFSGLSGELELQPHNIVHSTIGGWMGNPDSAALDPIFWLHHANIDRLWEKWLAQGGGRTNPTNDKNWMETVFTFFDENGARIAMSGKDVIRLISGHDYRYDDMPSFSAPVPSTKELPSKHSQVVTNQISKGGKLMTEGERTDVFIGQIASKNILDISGGTKEKGGKNKRVFLVLDDITFGVLPDGYFEVYLNLPKNEKGSFESPYYVGTIGLFFMHGKGQRVFEITPVLENQAKSRLIPENVSFSVVHKGLSEQGTNKSGSILGEISIGSFVLYKVE